MLVNFLMESGVDANATTFAGEYTVVKLCTILQGDLLEPR